MNPFGYHRREYIRFSGIFILYLVLIFCSFIAKGQTITLLGLGTYEPLENISVYTTSDNFIGLTNADGQIEISNAGLSDTLIFQHPSYYKAKYSLSDLKKENYLVLLIDRIYYISGEVVSPRKTKERIEEVIKTIDNIYYREVAYDNPQTTADMLNYSGNVYVQKSQMGGGSPVIRGFEANKVLIVVDGVRMNNAIYRSGHLQNVITIDKNILEHTELIFGPGSVIYGSDAMGGVIHFYTKTPKLTTSEKANIKTNYLSRVSSANFERSGHLDFNYGGKKVAFLSGISYSKYDDLKSGHAYHPDYPDHGKRFEYVKRFGSTDSIMKNQDPQVQKFSGYSQFDFTQKMRYKPNPKIDYILNVQYSTSSDIPRYDRLNDTLNKQLKYAEWYYGPQNRLLTVMDIKVKDSRKLFSSFAMNVAYQKIDEDRISRKLYREQKTFREEDVHVASTNFDFVKIFSGKNGLFYGFEAIYNQVQSNAYKKNIVTGATKPEASRYPAMSHTQSYALYLMHKLHISKKTILSEGIRFSRIFLHSEFSDTFYNLPFNHLDINTSNVSGSLGLLITPIQKLQIRISLSSSFRAPNVDDAGKVFDSSPGNVVIPNNGLSPEHSYTGEINLTKEVRDFFKAEAAFYYTYITNIMVRRDFQLNGQDSIMYEGEMSKVQAVVNQDKAFIKGLSFRVGADINEYILLKSSYNITNGRDLSNKTPLGHIPPDYGRTDIIYHNKKLRTSFVVMYNAWKRIIDYSPYNEDKSDEATRDGTPSWFTLNMHYSYQLNKFVRLQAGIENILDLHYKPFASGISAPGRNFILAARGSF